MNPRVRPVWRGDVPLPSGLLAVALLAISQLSFSIALGGLVAPSPPPVLGSPPLLLGPFPLGATVSKPGKWQAGRWQRVENVDAGV